ncbi:MAG: rRNA maturation RNase YbeY [Solirubrobacterales bacterium]|nr:rRNA maturation RNase YbeY [Solirubrobacterales bacterium]
MKPRGVRERRRSVAGLEIEFIADGVPAVADAELNRLCATALARVGVTEGHVAIEFVDEERIRELNLRHRNIDQPTDVLSFGVDEAGPAAGPRELGDIVICPARTEDLREAVIHGALHLTGMDHETDAGEMLALQEDLLRCRQT